MALAGNVGTPLAALVGEVDDAATIVCEVSSFQAEDSEAFAPDTALLLNVTEDHLDRHGTLEAYREAKLRVFANQTPEQVAVVPPGVEVPGAARRIEFGELPLPAEEIRLRGAHNLENAMGASAAAIASGVPEEAVAAALRTSRSAAPARGGGLGERRALRERLEGHERLLGGARDRGLRRRRARDPRRQPQGRRLRGSPRGGGVALRGGVPDRRGGRAARAGPRGHRAAPPLRRPRDGRAPRRRPPPSPATWSCSRPRAPASTSSATTRSEASASGRWSRGDESGAGRRNTSGCARKRPVEYSILYTATLCLLAGGAVMVYSASSAESLLSGPGDASYYLKRYVMFALAGLVLLQLRVAARPQGDPRRSRRCS